MSDGERIASVEDGNTDALIADAQYLAGELRRGAIPHAKATGIGDEDLVALAQAATADAKSQDGARPVDRPRLTAALARSLGALAPVTLQSLKDTDPALKRRWIFLWRSYEANCFSWTLMAWTAIFVVVAIGGDVFLRYYGPPQEQTEGLRNLAGLVLQSLTPFTYGAIGASVYLLRSLHHYIYARTFDRLRKPEYVNRIGLGAVAGGAAALLVGEFGGTSGVELDLSAAALGFLIGYNNEPLFAMIERVTQAVFPKPTARKTGADAGANDELGERTEAPTKPGAHNAG